ncbi:gibberellin-regulated protein 1-like [Asparagus officinalis]|uniref:gibberellin-regulated protein 1-like n=1 Tax=Asparagus officinalis TaxID=4686 RepID=UPI00098E5B91|nr:gibberellin-regulated protein 1-like [Asparagus officinalis]
MASSRFFIASLLLFVLALHLVESQKVEGPIGSKPSTVAPLDCGGACEIRCSKSSRPNLCKRACGTCCTRCGCVPAGTYGYDDSCLCYATMTTHGGVRKCP